LRCSRCGGKQINTRPAWHTGRDVWGQEGGRSDDGQHHGHPKSLRAKPGRFVEDIAGDELPMRESDDSFVVISDNGREYRVTARVEQKVEVSAQERWAPARILTCARKSTAMRRNDQSPCRRWKARSLCQVVDRSARSRPCNRQLREERRLASGPRGA
jgi:hypothetical protein